jgi:hypothetical protein
LLVDERVAVAGWRPWPQLDWLIRAAATYRSSEGCCLPAPPPPQKPNARPQRTDRGRSMHAEQRLRQAIRLVSQAIFLELLKRRSFPGFGGGSALRQWMDTI